MKNSQKGFIVPVLIVIIALLVIGGGVYVYKNKKTEAPLNTGTPQTNNQTPSVATNQTILNSLITDWKKIGPSILPGFPAVNQAFYGYPNIIQFIGNNRIVISYQDDFNPLFAVLSYDTNQKQFSYLDGLRSSPFKVSETLWNTWRKKYGDVSFTPQTYQFSSTRTGDVVYSSDWKLITKNPFVSSNSSPQTTGTGHVLAFEQAVNNSDFGNASKYFADKVYVLLEGSSCCGEIPASQAKMYLENETKGLLFTFNPNDAVVKEYMTSMASDYPNRRLIKDSPKLYFDELSIGVESDVSQQNKASIGYKVSNDKITVLFINKGRDR